MTDPFMERRGEQLEREFVMPAELAARFADLDHAAIGRDLWKVGSVLMAVVREMGGILELPIADVLDGGGAEIDFRVENSQLIVTVAG